MREKMHDFIAIFNSVGHANIFIAMTCNPYCQRYKMRYLRIKGQTIDPICVIVSFV